MNQVFYGLIAIFALAAVFLIFHASKEGTSLVFLPSDLASKGKGSDLARIRVAGRVSDLLPVHYTLEPEIELRFGIVNNPQNDVYPSGEAAAVPVVYRGLRPDMFTVGRDVIIDGSYENGVIKARTLLTQCPSKYEAADPYHNHIAGEQGEAQAVSTYE